MRILFAILFFLPLFVNGQVFVDNVAKMRNSFFGTGAFVETNNYYQGIEGGGARYRTAFSEDATHNGFDTITSTRVPGLYFIFQYDGRGVDISQTGAIANGQFLNRKNPFPAGNGTGEDNSPYFQRMFDYLGRQVQFSTNSSPTAIATSSRDYYVNAKMEVPQGVNFRMTPSSMLMTDTTFKDTLIVFREHYGTKHEVSVYRGIGSSTLGAKFFPINTDILPSDTSSIGICYIDCRQVEATVSARNFVSGLLVTGTTFGSQENHFHIKELYNNRFGIYLKNIGGGWANQNTFDGSGAVKMTNIGGTFNSSSTWWQNQNPKAALIHIDGANNNHFENLNLEGSSGNNGILSHAVYDSGTRNNYVNIRGEGLSSPTEIYFENILNTRWVGGYGFTNLFTGVMRTATSMAGFTKNVAGSMFLGGPANGSSGANARNSSTLILQGGVTGNILDNYIELRGKNHRNILEIDGNDEVKYYGRRGANQGKNLRLKHIQKQGSETVKTFVSGTTYTASDLVDDGGTQYYIHVTQQYNNTLADYLADDDVELIGGKMEPVVKLGQDGLEADQISGVIDFGETEPNVPSFLTGFAIGGSTVATTTVTGAMTIDVEKVGSLRLDNTSGSIQTVTLDGSNIQNGQIILITNNSTASNDIELAGIVNQSGGSTLTISQRGLSVFCCTITAGGVRQIRELFTNT